MLAGGQRHVYDPITIGDKRMTANIDTDKLKWLPGVIGKYELVGN